MSQRAIVSLGVVVTCVVAAYVGWSLRARWRLHDSLFFVAGAAARHAAAHPDATRVEIHAATAAQLRQLRDAGVTSAWLDDAGRLVDPWGSPLVIVTEATLGRTIAICRSVGPDRRAGTWDDVVRTHELEQGSLP